MVEDMEPRHLERLWNLDVWRGWAGPKATRELLWSMDWPGWAQSRMGEPGQPGFLERLGRAQSHMAEAVKPGFPKKLGPLDRLQADRSRRLNVSMRVITEWASSGSGR